MSSTRPEQPPRPTRVLCLGEALVDLICEQPIDDLAQAIRSAEPLPGGSAVKLPGDGSARRRREALRRGTIDIPDPVLRALLSLRDELIDR